MIQSLIVALALAAIGSTPSAQSGFLSLGLHPGDRIVDVFSRTVVPASGPVARVSGYAAYSVRSVSGGIVRFGGDYAYYGYRSGPNVGALDVRGGLHWTMKGTRTLDTSSSGPVYNSWLWGGGPKLLAAGTAWTTKIPQSWECGPAGVQHVRVLSVDPINGRIVLERSGSGYGSPANRRQPKLDGKPARFGLNVWKGIAVVRRGVIESDFLLIHRQVIAQGAPARGRMRIETEQITLGIVPP